MLDLIDCVYYKISPFALINFVETIIHTIVLRSVSEGQSDIEPAKPIPRPSHFRNPLSQLQIGKFADTVAETFKQFANIIKQEHERQATVSHQLKRRQPQALKLAQQANNPGFDLNIPNGRAMNHGNAPQQIRLNLYTGEGSAPTQQKPQVLTQQRPQNAFTFYIQEKRGPILKANPNLDFTSVTRELTQKWKQMTSEQKQPYIEKYEQMKKREQQQNAPNPNYHTAQPKSSPPNNSSIGQELSTQVTAKYQPINIPESKVMQESKKTIQQTPECDEDDDDVFDDMIPEAQKQKKAELKMQKIKQKEEDRTKQIQDDLHKKALKPTQNEHLQPILEESKIGNSIKVPKPDKTASEIEDLLNNDPIEEEKYSVKKIRQAMVSQRQGVQNEHNQNDQISVNDKKDERNDAYEDAKNAMDFAPSLSEDYFGQHPHLRISQNEETQQTPEFKETPFELIKEEHHQDKEKTAIIPEQQSHSVRQNLTTNAIEKRPDEICENHISQN